MKRQRISHCAARLHPIVLMIPRFEPLPISLIRFGLPWLTPGGCDEPSWVERLAKVFNAGGRVAA